LATQLGCGEDNAAAAAAPCVLSSEAVKYCTVVMQSVHESSLTNFHKTSRIHFFKLPEDFFM